MSPQRREQRRTHLDASVVPVEQALLARAEALEAEAEKPDNASVASGLNLLAGEFRDLAEELHFW
jgi:hypothetical protein